MLAYGVGECANSLVMNGVFGFAMIFFTKALGLNPKCAGVAMSASVVWKQCSKRSLDTSATKRAFLQRCFHCSRMRFKNAFIAAEKAGEGN